MKVNVFLVMQAKRGNQEAFIQLVQEYELVLYNMARRFLKEEKDVEDVLQETIISAYQNIQQVKKAKYFYTWLCRILINQCKKTLSKEEWFEEIDETDCVLTPNYDEKNEMNNLVNQLTQKYRIPLILYYYNGFSIKEIAEILDEPLGTVKSKLSRGKALLRKAYQGSNGGLSDGQV